MKKKALYAAVFLVYMTLSNCSDDLGLQQNKPNNFPNPPSNSQELDSRGEPHKVLRKIDSFNIELPSGVVVGKIHTNEDNQTSNFISLVIPDGTSLTSLTPTIVISPDATSVSPESGVANDFLQNTNYLVQGPAPFTMRNYIVAITYPTDFFIYSTAHPFPVHPNAYLLLWGNFGLPASDYTATFINQTTGVRTLVNNIVAEEYTCNALFIKIPLTLGTYKVIVARRSIEKEVPGLIIVE